MTCHKHDALTCQLSICISIHAAVHSCPFETQERNLAEKPKVRAVGGAGRAQIEKSNKFIHFYIAEPT